VHSADHIQIDTPEQISLELPLAGIGSRFLGLAIDTVLQFVLYIAASLLVPILVISSGRHLSWIPASFVPALIILFIFCIYWGYFAFFEIVWKGQTPGKRLAKIRVIHQSGRPINVYEAIGRNLLRVIDGLPGIYGVGIVCMMISSQHRRVGDYVAGTVVVVSPVNSQLVQLTSEELVLIETYLHRRADLGLAVRDRTAYQIATRITQKTGLQRDPNQSLDDFLEAVARQVRDTARFR
jgi:uncharacterized RDD family membrane protein YckC